MNHYKDTTKFCRYSKNKIIEGITKCQFCKKIKKCYYITGLPCVYGWNGNDGRSNDKMGFHFPMVFVCVDCLKKGTHFRLENVMGGVVESYVSENNYEKARFYEDED